MIYYIINVQIDLQLHIKSFSGSSYSFKWFQFRLIWSADYYWN